MRTLREIVGGLTLAFITTLTVLGGMFLAISESGGPVVTQPAGIATATAATFEPPMSLATIPSPAATPTLASTAIAPIPSVTGTTFLALTDTSTFVPTTTLVPTTTPSFTFTPQFTQTSIPCNPPPSWVPYTVRPGDTLFELSLRFQTSVQQLQFANCLSDTDIKYGQRLFVPFVPTPVPSATATQAEAPAPTDTPAPAKLRITGVVLLNIALDATRPNGAIASIRVDFAGGSPPYTYYDEDIPQSDNPIQTNTECGGTLIHTVRIVSGDGQSDSQTYYFSPITCP